MLGKESLSVDSRESIDNIECVDAIGTNFSDKQGSSVDTESQVMRFTKVLESRERRSIVIKRSCIEDKHREVSMWPEVRQMIEIRHWRWSQVLYLLDFPRWRRRDDLCRDTVSSSPTFSIEEKRTLIGVIGDGIDSFHQWMLDDGFHLSFVIVFGLFIVQSTIETDDSKEIEWKNRSIRCERRLDRWVDHLPFSLSATQSRSSDSMSRRLCGMDICFSVVSMLYSAKNFPCPSSFTTRELQ